MEMLQLNDLHKTFNPGTVNEKVALNGVSLHMEAGDFATIVGSNGAGKSTTIRLLMNALRPDSGTAAALGVDVSAPEFLNAKEDIGVVLDEGCFPETLTAPQVGRVMAVSYTHLTLPTILRV